MFSGAADFVVNLLSNVKAESESDPSSDDPAKLAQLRAAIGVGIQQLRTAPSAEFDAEDIMARGRSRLAAKQAAAHA